MATQISERATSPQDLSFGWQRARLLGAFFNGVFLLALGISIFLQSIERFIDPVNVEDPKLVLIMGCVGLGVNIASAMFLHGMLSDENMTRALRLLIRLASEHHHRQHGHDHNDDSPLHIDGDRPSAELQPLHPHAEHKHNLAQLKAPGRDLGMMGVLIHVICDALNNIGVIISALVIWLATEDESRFYADPATSIGISLMIFLSAIPLVKNSGTILLQSAPSGVDLGDVKHDLEKVGVSRCG